MQARKHAGTRARAYARTHVRTHARMRTKPHAHKRASRCVPMLALTPARTDLVSTSERSNAGQNLKRNRFPPPRRCPWQPS
eukprot:8452302-Alexandrium_andersonii.AAC.1